MTRATWADPQWRPGRLKRAHGSMNKFWLYHAEVYSSELVLVLQMDVYSHIRSYIYIYIYFFIYTYIYVYQTSTYTENMESLGYRYPITILRR